MPVQRATADSCPGVLRPHLAADGALARFRAPGGELPTAALRGLAEVSADLADGDLGLTSRGNMQVRGVPPEKVALLETRLEALGLLPHPTHERVRNILASPLSGLAFSSIDDVCGLVGELDTGLCGRVDLSELPGRFLFGLDDGTGDITGEEPDVLVVAVQPGRYEVRPSGASSGVVLGRAQVVEAALLAATAFLAERARQQSQAWRVNELAGGAEAMVDALVEAGFESAQTGFLPVTAQIPEPGLIEQREGRFSVCAVVPLGILNGEQLEALAACCELASDDELTGLELLEGVEGSEATPLRITPWRRVIIRDLELPAALAAQELLASVGLVVEPGSAWARVSACAGQPGCAKSLTDVQADARAFAEISLAEGPLVHWAGCGRGCGTPHGGVALLAESDGYRVVGELTESDRRATASSSLRTKDENPHRD